MKKQGGRERWVRKCENLLSNQRTEGLRELKSKARVKESTKPAAAAGNRRGGSLSRRGGNPQGWQSCPRVRKGESRPKANLDYGPISVQKNRGLTKIFINKELYHFLTVNIIYY